MELHESDSVSLPLLVDHCIRREGEERGSGREGERKSEEERGRGEREWETGREEEWRGVRAYRYLHLH